MNLSGNIYFSDSVKDLFPLIDGKKVFSIIDRNVAHLPFVRQLDGEKIIIDVSEERKSIESVCQIISDLLHHNADRECFLLGIGGGITTDILGFVASVYKRGVKFGLVPTTLLAQVDAAVGGKNGVNFDHHKNMIGTITEADFVFIAPEILATLPEKEIRCGLAEMLKTFILADGEAYSEALLFFKEMRAGEEFDRLMLKRLIRRAVEIKQEIVADDLYEKGQRRLLNLGHTFAHAIEHCSENWSHGEAVAAGIIIAAKIAVRLGLLQETTLQQLISDFAALGLPTTSPLSPEHLFDAIENDKKRIGDSIYFVLPTSIGGATVKLVTIDELKSLSLTNDLL